MKRLMKRLIYLITLAMLAIPATVHAQDRQEATLRDKLMPSADALSLRAPVKLSLETPTAEINQPALRGRPGMGYMIAGGALFVAGLIVGGDGGTVLILTGAGIGAYGLYLYFR